MPNIIIHEAVDTIVALRDFSFTRGSDTIVTGSTLHVCGYHAVGDDGGGLYRWDSTSTVRPNMGTVIAPRDRWDDEGDPPDWTAGRWILQHNGVVTVRQFGAIGVESNDPTELDDLHGTGKPFVDDLEILAIYDPYLAGPFTALNLGTDTMDWAAVQMAVLTCTKGDITDSTVPSGDLPGLEVPSGVYMCSRPVWLGDDQLYEAGDENQAKAAHQLGFSMLGQRGGTRQQVDLSSANIWLIEDRTNWYCLSMSEDVAEDTYYLVCNLIDKITDPVELDLDKTAAQIQTALNTALDPVYEVDLKVAGSTTLRSGNIFFQLKGLGPVDLPPEFHGEILAYIVPEPPEEMEYADFVHCFPDSGVLSFRRTASFHYRVENISLRGNNGQVGQAEQRNASFGVLYVTTQFFGHVCQNMDIADVDTAVGLLQGTGSNGEQTRMDRIHAEPVRRMLYTNAPQAFHQEFLGWNAHLQNIDTQDVTRLVFAEFDHATKPGFGANFYNAGATFGANEDLDEPDFDGTLLRVRRGTGTVQFIGGRFEHVTRLFNYDAVSGQGIENNLDVTLRGVEFTVMGGDERRFLHGENFEDVPVDDTTGTQYGFYAEDCTIHTLEDEERPEFGDLIMESLPVDKIRCVFERCRYLGVRSFQQRTYRAGFRHCYRNDFLGAGINASPLREFTDEAPTPGVRTQSLRNAWQDTPWIQTGPRFNALKNADLQGQERSTANNDYVDLSVSSWEQEGAVDDPVVFGKWGDFSDANISPSPESFYLALKPNVVVRNVLDFIDLDVAAEKVVTYQCLCRIDGIVRFALVNTEDATVYDEVIVNHEGSPSDLTLVTLRMLLQAAGETDSHCKLTLTNLSESDSALYVTWQQAWGGTSAGGSYPLAGGLANAGFVRTQANTVQQKTYPWAVNAIGVRAAGRFQLPLLDTLPTEGMTPGGDAQNMGWKSPVSAVDYDLESGALYWDDWQKGMMAFDFGAGWYLASQPIRLLKDPANNTNWVTGDQQLVYYTVTTGRTINLDTTVALVAPGTTVRIGWHPTGVSSGSITVNCGHTSATLIPANSGRTFVFFDDGGTGRWLAC